MKKPLVSILIASHNKEKYVKRCIKSCLNQSYKNLEIIFVDDNSKDRSFEIAKKFKKVKTFKKKQRKHNSKFNTYFQIDTYCYGYKKSKGKILALLDSDDFFKKNKIREVVNYFNKNSRSSIVFDLPIYYYSKSRKIYTKKIKNKNNIKKDIWPKFPIAGSCISFKKKFFTKFLKLINNKKFSMLTIDFRLAVIANTILNDFNIINQNLTYYFQDKKGESISKFKKFSKNWWTRRKQAHNFMRMINKKNKISLKTRSDYLTTNIIDKIYNFV